MASGYTLSQIIEAGYTKVEYDEANKHFPGEFTLDEV